MLEAPLTRRRPPPAPSLLPGGRRRCVSAVRPFPGPARGPLLRGPSSGSRPPSLCPALARSHGGGWSPWAQAPVLPPSPTPGGPLGTGDGRSGRFPLSPSMSWDLQTEAHRRLG